MRFPQPADFALKVDGEPLPIKYFTEVRGGDAIEGPADEPVIPGVPQLAPGTPVGTSYLVFIDDFYPLQRDRDHVIERIAADLPRLRPEDRMAVVAYDGMRLEMLQSWSQSVPELERVFRKAMTRPAKGLQREADDRRFTHDGRADRITGHRSRLLDSPQMRLDTDERAYAEILEEQVQGIVAVIDGLVVNGSAKVVATSAKFIRHIQSGYIYHYAFAMILGLLALMLLKNVLL